MKFVKYISFGSMALITVFLMVATIIEKYCGTAVANDIIYHSPLMIALWVISVAFSLIYILRRISLLSILTLLLHLSFVVILAGAATTFFFSKQGKINLTIDESKSTFVLADGENEKLPFTIILDSCYIEYYPGTTTAEDYVSEVKIKDNFEKNAFRISMNHVAEYKNYRFFQTSLGSDKSVLSISYDPWGIGITYAGYILLALSMLSFFFSKKTQFKKLFTKPSTACLLLLLSFDAAASNDSLHSIPEPLAKNLGKIYVYWGDRVMPLQTMAQDFCLKIYGSNSFRGFSAEQVVAGWLFFYDEWKRTPFIKVKGEQTSEILNIRSKYAALTEFYNNKGYKLENAQSVNLNDRGLHETDEKVGLVTSLCTGSSLRIFPIHNGDGSLIWLSPADNLTHTIDTQTYSFITNIFDQISREIFTHQWKNADNLISELKEFQLSESPEGVLPTGFRLEAEMLYNKISSPLPPASVAIIVGILSFIMISAGPKCKLEIIAWVINILLFLWITSILSLRWIIGRHIPLSNGYETMLAISWISSFSGVIVNLIPILKGYRQMLLPSAMLICGLSLMVAFIGRDGASVSYLMPVLTSPLLCLHVLLVMCSYALFGIIAIMAASALICDKKDKDNTIRIAKLNLILLYPALFLLTAGIFVGAVWANQSWGRYWGWDSKETWALVTMLIYAFPMHRVSWTWLQSPKNINIYLLCAFLSVLMTYFGVNYFLSGLHSYA